MSLTSTHDGISDYKSGPKQAEFSPYAMHGGTVLAVAGPDFAIIASDTRLSEGFAIYSRESPKTYRLTSHTILGAAGFHGDVLTLTKNVAARLKMYNQEHGKSMKTSAVAAMLSTMLYQRRFFPFYVYNIIAGIDDEGKGCVYSFDPVGSYERETYRAGGSAAVLIQPLIDNQIGGKNQTDVKLEPLTVEKAVSLVKDVFISAAERDIYTGDGLNIEIINKDGVTSLPVFPLRKD